MYIHFTNTYFTERLYKHYNVFTLLKKKTNIQTDYQQYYDITYNDV